MKVKLKEKDQEVKLNELKARELKRQVPNTRLKPMQTRHSITEELPFTPVKNPLSGLNNVTSKVKHQIYHEETTLAAAQIMDRKKNAFTIPNRLDEPIYPSQTPEVHPNKMSNIPMALIREKRQQTELKGNRNFIAKRGSAQVLPSSTVVKN